MSVSAVSLFSVVPSAAGTPPAPASTPSSDQQTSAGPFLADLRQAVEQDGPAQAAPVSPPADGTSPRPGGGTNGGAASLSASPNQTVTSAKQTALGTDPVDIRISTVVVTTGTRPDVSIEPQPEFRRSITGIVTVTTPGLGPSEPARLLRNSDLNTVATRPDIPTRTENEHGAPDHSAKAPSGSVFIVSAAGSSDVSVTVPDDLPANTIPDQPLPAADTASAPHDSEGRLHTPITHDPGQTDALNLSAAEPSRSTTTHFPVSAQADAERSSVPSGITSRDDSTIRPPGQQRNTDRPPAEQPVRHAARRADERLIHSTAQEGNSSEFRSLPDHAVRSAVDGTQDSVEEKDIRRPDSLVFTTTASFVIPGLTQSVLPQDTTFGPVDFASSDPARVSGLPLVPSEGRQSDETILLPNRSGFSPAEHPAPAAAADGSPSAVRRTTDSTGLFSIDTTDVSRSDSPAGAVEAESILTLPDGTAVPVRITVDGFSHRVSGSRTISASADSVPAALPAQNVGSSGHIESGSEPVPSVVRNHTRTVSTGNPDIRPSGNGVPAPSFPPAASVPVSETTPGIGSSNEQPTAGSESPAVSASSPPPETPGTASADGLPAPSVFRPPTTAGDIPTLSGTPSSDSLRSPAADRTRTAAAAAPPVNSSAAETAADTNADHPVQAAAGSPAENDSAVSASASDRPISSADGSAPKQPISSQPVQQSDAAAGTVSATIVDSPEGRVSPSSTQEPVTAQITGSVLRALHTTAQAAEQRDRTLTIRLDPPELGTLTIQLKSTGSGMDVHLDAADPVTAEMLSSRIPEIESALRNRDVPLHRIQMNEPGTAFGSSTSTGQQPGNGSAGTGPNGHHSGRSVWNHQPPSSTGSPENDSVRHRPSHLTGIRA